MKPLIYNIANDVFWIGALDPNLRTFDIVMETKYGTTYNSYFIKAAKNALVETVKEKFFNEYKEKILALTKPEDIHYIIVNHTEPDHSGSLKKMLSFAPNAKVVGSGAAIKYLQDQIGCEFPHIVAKDGQILDLGGKTIRFIAAPNLHWPDSMYSYLLEDEVLFTCDSFGAHYCDEKMFDAQVENYDDAFKYYYDVILRPYAKHMLKAIEKIKPLSIKAICTGHGPILQKNWKKYVELSEAYSKQALAKLIPNKILILYVSAYGNTGEIAKKIAEGAQSAKDVTVETLDIEQINIAILADKIEESSAYIFGSPTINQNILLQIYQMFALINPVRDRGKLAASFGSYGWSGEAQKIIPAILTQLKLNVFEEQFFLKFTPHEKDKNAAFAFGVKFAEKMKTLCAPSEQ